MKALVTLLGLITASCLSGEAVIVVRVKAYIATGELVLGEDDIPRGTRVLLTCNLEGLPEGSVVTSYKWYYNCPTGQCEIHEDPYYTVVNDTLLVDSTFWDGGRRRHTCKVEYQSEDMAVMMTGSITHNLTDSSAALFFTPTSLLLNNSLITDVQQITGSNGQQWINCTRGSSGSRLNMYSAADSVITSGKVRTGSYPANGLYYCSDGQSEKHYVNIYLNKLRNSSYLPTPIVSGHETSMWTLTSPDGSRVERYIVEFDCRVRNITFVEKYMSVSASGGTGRVATNVSCFGGLGQLYRVKVWAVSQTYISGHPAVKLINTGDEATWTTQVMTSTPTTADTETPIRVPASTRNSTSSSTPSGTISSSPENANTTSEGDQPGTDASLEVVVSIAMFLFLMVLALVGLIVLAALLKRRAAHVQTTSIKERDNSSYKNPVVVEREERGVGADYEDVDKDKEQISSTIKNFDLYVDVNRKGYVRNAKKPALKASSTPASATDVGELYAVVDMSKKKGAKKKEEDESTVTNKDDLYTMPMKKDKMTGEGMGASGGAEKSEDYDDVVELKYEPKTDSEPGQQSEGDEKSSNADMLYAVVDKCL